jgi:hypothetical protein
MKCSETFIVQNWTKSLLSEANVSLLNVVKREVVASTPQAQDVTIRRAPPRRC